MATQYVPSYGPGGGGPGTSPAAGASPDAFGAAVGAGISDVAEAIGEKEDLAKQRQREATAADATVKLTDLQTTLNADVQNMRDQAPPGAPGHAEAVAAHVNQSLADLRQSYAGAGKRVLQMFDENAANIRHQFVTREDDWQHVQLGEKQVTDTDASLSNLTALARAAGGDPGSYATFSHLWNSGIETSVSDVKIREKMRGQGNRAIDRAWVEGLVDSHPDQVKEALTTPTLTAAGQSTPNPLLQPGHLTGQDINELIKNADTEMRERAAAARAQEAHDRSLAAAQASLLHDRFDKGDTPAPEDIKAAAALVAQHPGPESEKIVYDLNSLGEQVSWRKQTTPWTVPQFDATIEQLEAKGDKRTPEEGRELQFMEAERTRRAAQPVEQQEAAIGRPPPPLNWSDPATIDARKAWAIAAHARHPEKETPYLTQDDRAVVSEKLNEGPAAQLETIAMLQRFGAPVAGDIIRRIAPGNAGLALAAGLPAETAREVAEGPGILKARPDLWDEKEARAINQEIAPGIPPAMQEEVFAAAKGIYGSRAAPENAWSEGNYRMALQRAMSAQGHGAGMRGGMQTYNDLLTWIPPTMTKSDFENKLSRATPQDIAAASGGLKPFWGDHKAVRIEDFRKLQLVPAQDDSGHYVPGLYYAQSRLGGVLHTSAGRPWRLDVTKLR